mgnify:CR=1 FL=1|tara:strand:+ start:6584 stop:7201 length:618 start_codon:yes stop_codon:yes gene_type:complete
MKTLSRKQITEGLDQIPMAEILSVPSKALTPKMRSFAREVAKGSTKADAYRRSYKQDASKSTTNNEPYRLTADPRIAREIAAYQHAIESAKQRTPAALRELVIQSLVSVITDPDEKGAVRVQAAKVLGTVTEVAAFTERKEVRTISSSVDVKARVMDELKRLMITDVEDVTAKEADSLLAELVAQPGDSDDPHPPGMPPNEGSVT